MTHLVTLCRVPVAVPTFATSQSIHHLVLPLGSLVQTRGPKAEIRDGDWASLIAAISTTSDLLEAGASVVIHCFKGLHRTGVVGYNVVRLGWLESNDVLRELESVRPLCVSELRARTGARPQGSVEQAEWISSFFISGPNQQFFSSSVLRILAGWDRRGLGRGYSISQARGSDLAMASHEASSGLPQSFYLLPDAADDVVLRTRALAWRKAGSIGPDVSTPGRAAQEASKQLLQAYGQLLPPRGALPPYDAAECRRRGDPPRVRAPMHVWSKRARWYFHDEKEYPSDAPVDLEQALDFFRDRPGNEVGSSLGDLLGLPMEQEEGWRRLELVSRRPAEQDDEAMVRGWHGTAFDSINSILRDGLRESTGESGTRVLVRNGRPVTGVYFHREEQRYKALGYAELVPLWRNGVFFQVAVEILVRSESASKVPSSDQWVAQAGGIQVVALWLRGLTKKDLPYGVPVREAWLPSCESQCLGVPAVWLFRSQYPRALPRCGRRGGLSRRSPALPRLRAPRTFPRCSRRGIPGRVAPLRRRRPLRLRADQCGPRTCQRLKPLD